ncbi:MAG TPA: helix-turn-helix domain-containing protein [Acidilobales archaeon]|nr:helix-turn-helix domain-containing protein [Acidilobales archaeon]
MVRGKYQEDEWTQLFRLRDEVVSTLRYVTDKVEEINYPELQRGKKKSIDIVASTEHKDLIIKIQSDAKKLKRDELEDLIKSSKVLNALPIVISKFSGSNELEDHVIYIKNNVFIMNEKTFKGVVVERNTYVFNVKGNYLVKVDGKRLRRLREGLGLSLGDVAKELGVTRKTVYEYERESFTATVSTAVRLINVFGDDVIEPIDIRVLSELRRMYETALKLSEDRGYDIVNYLKSLGLKASDIKFSAPDVLASHEVSERVKLFIIDLRRRIRNVTAKIQECFKFSKVLEGDILVLSKDKSRDYDLIESSLPKDEVKVIEDSEISELRKVITR